MKSNHYRSGILIVVLITLISTGCKSGWRLSNPFAHKPKPAIDSPADFDDFELTPPPEQYTEGFTNHEESKAKSSDTSLVQKGEYESFPSSEALKTADVTQVAMNTPTDNLSPISSNSNNMLPNQNSIQQNLAMNQGLNVPLQNNNSNNFNQFNSNNNQNMPFNGMDSVPQYDQSFSNNNQMNNIPYNSGNLNNQFPNNQFPTSSYLDNSAPNNFNNYQNNQLNSANQFDFNNQQPIPNNNNWDQSGQPLSNNQYNLNDSANQGMNYNNNNNNNNNNQSNFNQNNNSVPTNYSNNTNMNNDFSNQYNSYNNTNSNGFTPGSIGGY
ncbi:MAG: hypothetical protein Q4C95_03540 [Planctomycetia bacterium]|nr:hypothetical protein [Planctomycetia bacterium]